MFHHYTGNRQFDLQINRLCFSFEGNKKVEADLKEIVPKLKDIPSWNKVWKEYALMREAKGDYDIAATYFFGAGFYLLEGDKDREFIQRHRLKNFYQAYADLGFEKYEIPYENTKLSAAKFSHPKADKNLLIFGGYDSNLEELILWFAPLKNSGYNLVIFEGPGQGNMLFKDKKSHFIMNFERPTAAVLDYFALDKVTALGLSWGGYFVMRAAAFEKRIEKVIALDIFYQSLDALMTGLNPISATLLKTLIVCRQEKLIDTLISREMKKSLDLSWKINRGYELTGIRTPYKLLKDLERHSMKNLGPLINQEVLLLAGEKDQYVPVRRLRQLKKELVNAGRVSSCLFTEKTGGEQHCQAGTSLALEAVKDFLDGKI
ncbi:alpha/beta fold hydrolase [Streptococcus devriesei]|uniref:alpha/beta fold hydrolase n=1 Tax=Streptococcus devriesei TaxID=231233 RepID=UPI0003FB7C52|nr:alpha/beta hydrolase [Streptococcus devriesei]